MVKRFNFNWPSLIMRMVFIIMRNTRNLLAVGMEFIQLEGFVSFYVTNFYYLAPLFVSDANRNWLDIGFSKAVVIATCHLRNVTFVYSRSERIVHFSMLKIRFRLLRPFSDCVLRCRVILFSCRCQQRVQPWDLNRNNFLLNLQTG